MNKSNKNTILSDDEIVGAKENNSKFNLLAYCEIDKYASKAYSIIHNVDERLNLGDITKVDTNRLPNNIDLIFHGSPCQSFSLAGKQHGGDKGSGTRSSLMWETVRIVKEKKPKIVCWENVKNVISKKHTHNFNEYIDELSNCGYNSYYKVLNAKDYGIPQNRERIFVVSIRKDIDNGKFNFPDNHKLHLRLKDLLEDNVDEKYYLSKELQEKITHRLGNKEYNLLGGMQKHQSVKEDGISTTLTSSMGTGGGYVPMINVIDKPIRKYGIFDDENGKHQAGSVWETDGLSPTLDTMQGGYRQPCIEVREKTKKGYKEAYEGDGIYINRPHQKRGCVQNNMIPTLKTSCTDVSVVVKDEPVCVGQVSTGNSQAGKVYSSDGISQTLCAGTHGYAMGNVEHNLRVRKLTPKECWRLMGFDDHDIDKCIDANLSNTQLYKMAGNSIVVNVLYYIFLELYRALPEVFDDLNMLSLFSGIGAPEKALERLYENIN